MTSLIYSRDELPVECPECDCLTDVQSQVSRDSYTEVADHSCPMCFGTFRVMITED